MKTDRRCQQWMAVNSNLPHVCHTQFGCAAGVLKRGGCQPAWGCRASA